MSSQRPKRARRLQVWLLLVLAVVTWVIHGSLPTMGAGLWPLSGSTLAAIVAVCCAVYLYIHRDKGGTSGSSRD